MLGLQTTYDVQTTLRLHAAASSSSSSSSSSTRGASATSVKNNRSWRFSQNLFKAGFDNVVGQSSSLTKHTKLVKGESPGEKERKRRSNALTKMAQEQFVEMQDQHALDDAKRLEEVQRKLDDLQRKKEARIRRDRSRRQRKVEYMAARKIQYFFRFVILDRQERAAAILRVFVRKVVNRNNISVASWASGVLQRFAKTATSRWKAWKLLKEAANDHAHGMWESVGNRKVAEIAARTMAAKFVSFQSMRQGLTLVARKQIAEARELSRRKKKESRYGKSRGALQGRKAAGASASGASPGKSESPKAGSSNNNRSGNKFPLLDSPTSSQEGGECTTTMSPPDTMDDLVEKSRRNFVNPSNIPGSMHNPPPDQDQQPSAGGAFGMGLDMGLDMDLGADLSEDEYDEDEELEKEHREQMRLAHAANEAAQQREIQARRKAIEKAKRQREEDVKERRILETMRQEAEEQARLDWLDEQDYKRERRARKITRTRKQNERDVKRAAKELVLMAAEDTMERKADKGKWVPGTIPKQKKKKEREMTEFELEMQEEREQEEAQAKEDAAIKLFELNKEQTAERLRKKKEAREKEQADKEEAEMARKEKMRKLEINAAAARERAVEARRIADMHAKQREKELAAIDAADKLGKGRTHNASGNPVLKGFVRPEDRGKANKGSKKRTGNSHFSTSALLNISSKVPVRDPTVRQWNYEVDPAAGAADIAGDIDMPIEELAEYKRFLSQAEEHPLHEVEMVHDHEDNPDYWPFGEESNDELDELDESVGSGGLGLVAEWGGSRENGDEDDVVQLGEQHPPEQMKPRSAELQPGGARKSKKGGKKGGKDAAANSSSSKKASVVAITGGVVKRPVVIPAKLQGSAYFQSYKSVKKAEQAVEDASGNSSNGNSNVPATNEEEGKEGGEKMRNEEEAGEVAVKKKKAALLGKTKSKRSVRRGKVATMLEMVNKARRKLGDASSKSAAALAAAAAGSQTTTQLSPGAQALLGGGTGAQSFADLGRAGTSSPDSLFAPKMATTLPHFPAPPKMAGFGPLKYNNNNNAEYDSSDDDVNAIHHTGAPPPEMIQQELGDVEGEPLTGSLDNYFFASKDVSEEGQKRFGTADFQNPNGDNNSYGTGLGLGLGLGLPPHSPIDKNPRMVVAPPPESAEERSERMQEEALNAECDMLLSRLEKRLGVTNGENQDNMQQPQQQSVVDTMPVSLSKIPVAASRIPVPKASKPRVSSGSGKAVAAQQQQQQQQGGGNYNPPGGNNNPQQQPKAPPKPKPQSMDLAASYLQRLKQQEDAKAEQAQALSAAVGGRSDYMGDYSIGVDLPSFALPVDAAGASAGAAAAAAAASSSSAATHDSYSKSLLEQWLAEDARDDDEWWWWWRWWWW